MAQASRYERGKVNAGQPAPQSTVDAFRVPWVNPLKGDERKAIMAQVGVKRGGLQVGVRVKF